MTPFSTQTWPGIFQNKTSIGDFWIYQGTDGFQALKGLGVLLALPRVHVAGRAPLAPAKWRLGG